MNNRTFTGIATAALVTTAGISVTNSLKKEANPSEGVVQAATVQSAQTPQQQFLNKAIPAATQASSTYGTYTSVMIAQAALESGWGQSTLAQAPNNNLFGIKGSYNGQSVSMNTSEYGNNGYYSTNAQFRKYPSYTESFNDNGALLRQGLTGNNAYYSGTWVENANSGTQATQGLQGKYATAPDYAQKLNAIIQANNLTQYDPKIQRVNETKTVQQTTAITNAPVDSSIVKSIGTAQKGQTVRVSEYITYANGVKHALTNLGWINAVAFGNASSQAPVDTNKNHNTETYTVQKVNEIIKISGASSLSVLNAPAGNPTGQKLPNGSRWKVTGYSIVNNVKYNRVGTNQWINDEYCAHGAAAENSASSQAPTNKPTNDEVSVTPLTGIAKVNYVPGYGIAVWKSPTGHTTGQYLPHGSRWKVSGSTLSNGKTWYRVGSNQWIDSTYTIWDDGNSTEQIPVTPTQKPTTQAPITQRPLPENTTSKTGVVTINYRDDAAVTVWTQPGGQPTGKYLQNNTNWRFFKTVEAYGQTWYNLGGNQWVPDQYVYVR